MFKHECDCGGDLYLIGFTGSCHIPINKDGFYLGDGPCDTEDEIVKCNTCHTTGPLEYIDDALEPACPQEYCESCNEPLDAGFIGLCEPCQPDDVTK